MSKLVIALSLLCSVLVGCADTGTMTGTRPDYDAPTMYRGGY